MKIFISNKIEILASCLKDQLFEKSRHPLAKRTVIVPNDRIKQELFLHFAHDPHLQVAMGFIMMTMTEALTTIFPNIPCQIELSLKIESVIDSINSSKIAAYLSGGGHERKASFCDKMSSLFLHYLTAPQERLMLWLKEEGWQQNLWRACFGEKLPWENCRELQGKLFLFHPCQLTRYQWNIFKHWEITCFLFSPSSMYWGDLKTFRQQVQLSAFEDYFTGDNPLLANWGQKGRQLLRYFEDEELIEMYAEPEGSTLLATLQKEMLSLSWLNKQKDSSIQLHSTPSKIREVEVVWDIIQELPFEPREIAVLAPSIQEYAPMIELIFRQRGGPYDFAILGLEAHMKNSTMQGLEDLLSLCHFRFAKEVVEKLLFCPSFIQRFEFTIEDVKVLREWIARSHIRYDLQGDHPFTWRAGLKRWVEALALTARENHMSIEFSQADLLSRFVLVIQQLEEELSTLTEKRYTLRYWSKYLIQLVDKFFIQDEELLRELENLEQMKIDGEFSFFSLQRVLQNIFHKKFGAVQASHLQAVRFTCLEKGALVPAKVVILMGMQEGAFPRHDPASSLQQLPFMSRVEEDKYLFLEAVCSAREKLIITYTRINSSDGKSQKPCSLVEELGRYAPLEITDHPFAQIQQHIPSPKPVPNLPTPVLNVMDVRTLKKLARHPLQYFFEESLGVDFEWREKETEFVLPPLEIARLRKQSLTRPLDELLTEMQHEGRLPVGSFEAAAKLKVEHEIEDYHAAVQKLQVNPDEIYSIELKLSCQSPLQLDHRTWVYPALQVKDKWITGKIDDLSPQGMLFHGDESLGDLLKVWPLYLIVRHLCGLPLLLTKKGKVSSLEIAHPLQALERYMAYAEKALNTPSPLMPKWARSVALEKKVPEAADEDEIVAWAQKRRLLPESKQWIEAWTPKLQEAIRELL